MATQEGLLEPGEKLLWEGRPRQGLMLRPRDTFMIPFSILWCGFAIFWESSVLSQSAPGFFALWGIPFVAAGLYFVFGRFLYDAFVRSGTFYALTDRRVLISAGGFRREVRSLILEGLTDLRLSENGDGRGTIKFGADPESQNRGFGSLASGSGAPAFEGIEDVRGVYRQIMAAQKKATNAES
jgi:hypothetical protein